MAGIALKRSIQPCFHNGPPRGIMECVPGKKDSCPKLGKNSFMCLRFVMHRRLAADVFGEMCIFVTNHRIRSKMTNIFKHIQEIH